ncbi:hypothetical protein Q7P37_000025 [Cladosporium fusiforme]
MRNPRLRSLFLAFADVLLFFPSETHTQSACLPLQNPVRKVVYEQPVSINTDILQNTTFYPMPEAAITVTNAPTSFDGITTLRWTSTESYPDSHSYTSSSQVAHSIELPPSPTPSQDTLVLIAMDRRRNQKRQSGSYFVNSNGTITNDCTSSPIYTARNGVLTATMNGVVYTYSTSPGVDAAAFVPNTVPGSITTTFSIGANAVLQWQNPSFYNGQANFCALQNGTVYAVFKEDAQPDGCFFISLSLFSVSSCQAISLATITGPRGEKGETGATGAQGLSGPTGAPGIQGIQGLSGPSGPSLLEFKVPAAQLELKAPAEPLEFKAPAEPLAFKAPADLQAQAEPPVRVGHQDQADLQMSEHLRVQMFTQLTFVSRATGAPGPSGTPGNIFSYMGCYVQSATSSSGSGKALSNYQASYTTVANRACSTACLAQNTIYFGTVNVGGSTGVDCWCGNAISYVTTNSGLLGSTSVTGPAGDNNCYTCIGGAPAGGVAGPCGNATVMTIAIFARSY